MALVFERMLTEGLGDLSYLKNQQTIVGAVTLDG